MNSGEAHEKHRQAVALRYDLGADGAPRVIAKGQRLLAEKIIEIARENNIHIHEDPDLVGLLAQLDIDTEIPEDLYAAVAEVLAFVYRVDNQLGGQS